MATIPFSADADRGEAKFFFTMACVMAASIVAGFAFNLAMGISSFGVPLLVHVHALVMFGFVALYLLQNSLILADNVALHKRLGWLSAIWVPTMLVLGMFMIRWSVQQHGVPPFLEVNEFLFSNPLMLILFAGLAAAAVTARANTGWHRRLMYGAFTILTGPGIGRLGAPVWFAIEPWGWWALISITSLGFVGAGMIADKRRYGAVHPAWFWVLGLIFATQIVADIIAYSDWGVAFTRDFVAGTPGGERPMQAFLPPA